MNPPARVFAFGAATGYLLASIACGPGAVTMEYRGGYAFSQAEREAIAAVAERAARDARELLPTLPAELRITVQTGERVIPETGETAEIGLPSRVYWTVDPSHAGGVVGVVNAQLRATLLHEFYHLVREAKFTPLSLADRAVNEGLATAFERDYGGASPLWGEYPSDVAAWTRSFWRCPVMRIPISGCSSIQMAGVGSVTGSEPIWPIEPYRCQGYP